MNNFWNHQSLSFSLLVSFKCSLIFFTIVSKSYTLFSAKETVAPAPGHDQKKSPPIKKSTRIKAILAPFEGLLINSDLSRKKAF